ncbi:hypothetical protein LTR05_005377 [Lithohypha guttulata]|uniref:Uncharacterized protein n=1 Tax=Lithohypha guttulata TaxID=1690604 RepID=A0AAN7SYQ2_9EURO|nr:hypothetical protein LTR05_005377 [Lithohypha guttulata]
MLRETQQENMLLREILNSRGVAFEVELQQRKNAIAMGGGPSHSARGISPSYSIAHSGSPYGTAIPPTAPPSQSGLGDFNPAGYTNGAHNIMSGHSPTAPNNSSPGTTHHSHSSPEMQEVGGSHDIAITDAPGIFEKEPQLGIDFILALEETCRDHSEYLVRRSMNSPNDPDEALFSGHALMASVPPPSHIDRTPPQKGGLQPTYPHQAPQASIHALQTLLNLSRVIKSEGYVEGGQVTPIMALQSLRGHYNYHSLTRDDVVGMIDAIRNKVRCYGFGAVMEDFELRDALATIFATKPEAYESFGNDMTSEIEEMYS